MKNKIFLVIVALVIALGAYLMLTNVFSPASVSPSTETSATKTYTNDTHGLSFVYPADYILTEAERGNAERGHYSIVLIESKDAQIPENGEGPTAITLDIYQNNLDKQTLLDWLNGNASSNYKQSLGVYASTTVADLEAVQYRWSGLYEGETTAFLHGADIVAVSVTFMTHDDAKIAAYRALLTSLRVTTN